LVSQCRVWPLLVLPVAPAGEQNAPAWSPVWAALAALLAAAEADALAFDALAEADAFTAPADAEALAAALAADDAFDEAWDLTEAAAEAACVADAATLFADEQPATMTNATAAAAIQVLSRTNFKNYSSTTLSYLTLTQCSHRIGIRRCAPVVFRVISHSTKHLVE
jgi:hypothetical protein